MDVSHISLKDMPEDERKKFWIGQSLKKVSDKSVPSSFFNGVIWGLVLSCPIWTVVICLVF